MRLPCCFFALGLVLTLPACEAPPEPIHVLVDEGCEGTNPLNCMLPWPSDRWLEEDTTTETGWRLRYSAEAIPLNKNEEAFDTEPYAFRDGFSPASMVMTVFDTDVDTSATPGMAVEGQWAASLEPGSPTVIVDMETGELVAHFVESDARAHEDDADALVKDLALFYLRPAARLQEDRSYAVALRNITLIDGSQPTAWPVFAALRDGVPTDSDFVEARRASYEEMFTALDQAGVEREGLVQAWRFHTASGNNIRGDLLAMRADALDRVPTGGGSCTVTSVSEDHSSHSFRRVDGTFEVPLYMDSPYSGARVVRGEDGLPEFQGWTDAPFTALIPRSLSDKEASPGPLLAFGHGLMGAGADEGGGSFVQTLGDEAGMLTVATDWQGMSSRDVATVGIALSDVSTFPATGERLMQGVINNVVMIRSFKGACRNLEELMPHGVPIIDEGEPYWLGISQGGIMGTTLMALSPEVKKGALLVGGMNYPLLIGRSLNFYDYEVVMRVWYPERVDREILMAMMISLWDHAEPNPWVPHLVQDPLPGLEAKQILYQVARHDSQVPNLASDTAARTMGIPQLEPALLDLWEIETEEGPLSSAYVYYDLDRTPPPGGNLPPTTSNGAHGDQRWIGAAMSQMKAFWQPDGMVQNFCDGVCDPD